MSAPDIISYHLGPSMGSFDLPVLSPPVSNARVCDRGHLSTLTTIIVLCILSIDAHCGLASSHLFLIRGFKQWKEFIAGDNAKEK